MITLEQLLRSRDERAAFQQKMLEEYPDKTLVSFTVQLPGPEKRNQWSAQVAEAGVDALKERFGEPSGTRDKDTGFEAYWLVREPALEAKRRCCEIEEKHPLGRLMDIDVIRKDGPVSRTEVGLEPRKCLLCGRQVRVCMRERTHSAEELLQQIKKMITVYGIQKINAGRN